MVCGPIDKNGINVNGVSGVAGPGFTEMFYMQNFCWEDMKDYPVKDFNLSNGDPIQESSKIRH